MTNRVTRMMENQRRSELEDEKRRRQVAENVSRTANRKLRITRREIERMRDELDRLAKEL